MSTTTEIKFEFYIDSTSEQDTSNSLSPADATDLGLNAGVVVDQLGGGITFNNAGSIKGGKTDWDVGIGFWLGYQPDAYKVAIGDPANEKVTWDGDDLVIDIDNTNLTVNGGTAGHALIVGSGGTIEFENNVQVLNELTDVTAPSPSLNQFLKWSGTAWIPANLGPHLELNDLSNVSVASPSANEVLQYDGTNWVASSSLGQAINDLTDVNITNVADDQFLVYNSSTSKWENVSGTEVLSINDLNDVITKNGLGQQTAQTGQYLRWNPSLNGGSWVPQDGAFSGSLNDLTDVTISGIGDDHVLQYNNSTSQFENVPISTAIGSLGGASEAFKTIAISGQSNVVADSATDTLTFVAGTGITLTTNASTDTITIASSGSGSSSSGVQDADVDTKIQVEESSDEDKIRFDTAGSERMIIDNSGNVGIGTSSPDDYYATELVVSAGLEGGITLASTNTTNTNYVAFADGTSGDSRYRGQIRYNHTDDKLDIVSSGYARVLTGSSRSERIRILSTGGITFDGETTEAHALDDYEEGTWTPHFADAATGGNYVTAGTQPTGSFTKIGNVVHLSCPAQNINPSGLSTSATLYIRNFPFTVSSAHLQTPCTSINFGGRAAGSMVGAYFMANPGGTYGFIVKPSSTGGGENTQGVANVLSLTQIGGAYTSIRFSITYIAA